MAVGVIVTVPGRASNRSALVVPLPHPHIVLQVLGLLGVACVPSLINIVFRDLKDWSDGVILLLIASPIAYTERPVAAEPQRVLLLNPLAYYIVAIARGSS